MCANIHFGEIKQSLTDVALNCQGASKYSWKQVPYKVHKYGTRSVQF